MKLNLIYSRKKKSIQKEKRGKSHGWGEVIYLTHAPPTYYANGVTNTEALT